MNILTPFAQLLAFLIELAMLGSFVYAGFSLRTWMLKVLVGIGVPVVAILIWGQWCAPRAETRLHMPWLAMVELTFFLLAAIMLWVAGKQTWAIALALGSIVSIMLSIATEQF